MPKEVTNEELARMIARGFEHVDGRFEEAASKTDIVGIKNDIKRLDGHMDHLDARVGRMEADLNEIRGNIVYKYEFEDLMARVKYLELKLNIESGK